MDGPSKPPQAPVTAIYGFDRSVVPSGNEFTPNGADHTGATFGDHAATGDSPSARNDTPSPSRTVDGSFIKFHSMTGFEAERGKTYEVAFYRDGVYWASLAVNFKVSVGQWEITRTKEMVPLDCVALGWRLYNTAVATTPPRNRN